MRNILIVGLRRSGTTILWETLSQNPEYTGYDEPFHPRLWSGVRENDKGTWDTLGEFWEKHGGPPVAGLLPITPLDEIDSRLSDSQKYYLKLLQKDLSVIDSVRVWSKLSHLVEDDGKTLIVHLVRSPIGWATAHIVPPDHISIKRRVANHFRRALFFHRSGGFNFWHYEEIYEHMVATGSFARRNESYITESAYIKPAYIKLLKLWWEATKRLHEDARRFRCNPVLTVTLEQFSNSPNETLGLIATAAGSSSRELDASNVSGVRLGHRPNDKRWEAAFLKAGVPIILSGKHFTGQLLESALAHCGSLE